MWLGGTLEEAENQTNQKRRKEGTNRAENSHQGAMIKIRILRFTVIEVVKIHFGGNLEALFAYFSSPVYT